MMLSSETRWANGEFQKEFAPHKLQPGLGVVIIQNSFHLLHQDVHVGYKCMHLEMHNTSHIFQSWMVTKQSDSSLYCVVFISLSLTLSMVAFTHDHNIIISKEKIKIIINKTPNYM